MAPTMKEAQILAAGVSYFSVDTVLGPDGEPMVGNNNKPITTTLRHEAMHGDKVKMSEHEFKRLEKLGAVREPSSAPTRPEIPAPTPFGVPVPNADQQMAAFAGPIMGHPAPSAGATDLQISRAEVAGALTPEQAAELERRALEGGPGDAGEAISDRDYEAATVPALEREIESRRQAGRDIKVEGTGSNGNVIKDDLVTALEKDDAENVD